MSQAIATHGDQNIFQDENGRPLAFYIDPAEIHKESLKEKIIACGGIIIHDPSTPETYIYLSSVGVGNESRPSFSPKFVEDSVAKGALQYLMQYQISEGSRDYVEKKKQTKNTTRFTPETDNYILEQVRMKPRFRTSHKFFEEIARHDALKNHTGNSVRSRFRAHLEHKLQYVYKTDEYDNLVLDANGQHIMVDVMQAKTMKNKFTAQDDYNLCNDVIAHVLSGPGQASSQSSYLDEDKFSVSISFFDEYARNNPQHSSSSWRDRYRKFARVYGLQKYRDDYQKALETKEGPKPMSRLTRRKNDDHAPRKKKLKPDLYTASASLAHAHRGGFLEDEHMNHHHLMQSQLDDNAAAAVANLAVAARGGHTALDEEIGEVKNSNIHEALRNHDAEAGRVNIEDEMVNAIHPNLTGNSDGGDFDIGLKEPDEESDPAKEMQYLPQNAGMDDIFDHRFYENDSKGVLDKVVHYLANSKSHDTEKVSEELVGLGFTRRFVGHVLRVTGANATYMNKYLTSLLRHVQESKDSDFFPILFVQGRNGFWTPEADEALMTKNYDVLGHMSKKNLARRRVFLGLEE